MCAAIQTPGNRRLIFQHHLICSCCLKKPHKLAERRSVTDKLNKDQLLAGERHHGFVFSSVLPVISLVETHSPVVQV